MGATVATFEEDAAIVAPDHRPQGLEDALRAHKRACVPWAIVNRQLSGRCFQPYFINRYEVYRRGKNRLKSVASDTTHPNSQDRNPADKPSQ